MHNYKKNETSKWGPVNDDARSGLDSITGYNSLLREDKLHSQIEK